MELVLYKNPLLLSLLLLLKWKFNFKKQWHYLIISGRSLIVTLWWSRHGLGGVCSCGDIYTASPRGWDNRSRVHKGPTVLVYVSLATTVESAATTACHQDEKDNEPVHGFKKKYIVQGNDWREGTTLVTVTVEMEIVFDNHCSVEYGSRAVYSPGNRESLRIDIGPMTRGTDGYCVW